MRNCRQCGRRKAADQFLAGKSKRPSSMCAGCRKKRAADHRRRYYASLSTDKRHELTHKRRARAYGVAHQAYSRDAILARWGYRCGYCGAPAEHLDHITALSRGGEDVEANIIPACSADNLSKGAKTLLEWCLTFAPAIPDA